MGGGEKGGIGMGGGGREKSYPPPFVIYWDEMVMMTCTACTDLGVTMEKCAGEISWVLKNIRIWGRRVVYIGMEGGRGK